MDLIKSIKISTAGMRVQGTRLRVISENIANSDSLPSGPGDEPYRRKQVSFKNTLDRALDAKKVQIDKIHVDKKDGYARSAAVLRSESQHYPGFQEHAEPHNRYVAPVMRLVPQRFKEMEP